MATINRKPPAQVRRDYARGEIARNRVRAAESQVRQQQKLIAELETRGCARDMLEARLNLLRIACDYFALERREEALRCK